MLETRLAPAQLNSKLSIDAAITVILTSCQSELIVALRAVLDRPLADEVHALRTALRRLRAVLDVAARWARSDSFTEVKNDAHELALALGEARDWDVLVAETLPRHALSLAGIADLAPLLGEASAARERSYRQMLARLDGPLPQKLLLGLALLLSERRWRGSSGRVPPRLKGNVKAGSVKALERARRRQMRHGKRILALSDEARHRLRIDTKRLGYTIDFLGPVWTKPRKCLTYRRDVKRLQDGLGALCDTETTHRLLERIGSETVSPEVHKAIGAILGWSARDKRDQLASIDRLWRAFRSAKPFW
jgi:triphosphatase